MTCVSVVSGMPQVQLMEISRAGVSGWTFQPAPSSHGERYSSMR